MSRNVVKSFYTIKESSVPRVIDNNGTVVAAIERVRSEVAAEEAKAFEWDDFGSTGEGAGGEFLEGLDPESLDALVGDGEEGSDEGATGGTVIKANVMAEMAGVRERALAEIEAEKKRMLEEAEAEVNLMKNLAAEETARDKSVAMQMGRKEGYEEGIAQANEEFERMKAEIEVMRKRLEEEYEDKMFDLEPQFVRHITNIYEKVFQIELADKKDIVVNILRNAMQKIEGTKNYIIHVSKEDYSFVNERKQVLLEAALTADVIIDIVEDMTMRQGDCMIETANGIFDCGIDTQLSAIKNRLTLLSYNGRD